MPPVIAGSVDTQMKFEDLSGTNIAAYVNPYDAMLEDCKDDPVYPIFSFYTDEDCISRYCCSHFSNGE